MAKPFFNWFERKNRLGYTDITINMTPLTYRFSEGGSKTAKLQIIQRILNELLSLEDCYEKDQGRFTRFANSPGVDEGECWNDRSDPVRAPGEHGDL